MNNIHIAEANWTTQQAQLTSIRRQVFVEEQQVPEELEWDEFDSQCRHVLAIDIDTTLPVGTGRLSTDGKIGRMAVIMSYRKQGVGCKILQKLVELAMQDGLQQVYIHAQIHAAPFYQGFDFIKEGETFMEAGIPHVKMVKLCNV